MTTENKVMTFTEWMWKEKTTEVGAGPFNKDTKEYAEYYHAAMSEQTPPIAGIKEAIEAKYAFTGQGCQPDDIPTEVQEHNELMYSLRQAAHFGASLQQKQVDWEKLEQDFKAQFVFPDGVIAHSGSVVFQWLKDRLQGSAETVNRNHELDMDLVREVGGICDTDEPTTPVEQGEVMSAEQIIDKYFGEDFFIHNPITGMDILRCMKDYISSRSQKSDALEFINWLNDTNPNSSIDDPHYTTEQLYQLFTQQKDKE